MSRAIFAGLRQLDIELEDARPMFKELTGKISIKAMNESDKTKVVGHLRSKGFKLAKSKNKLAGSYAPKLQALWIAGYNLGVVKNRNDQALLAFVKRQTNIEHTRFLHYPEDANKAIECIKAWLNREAFVDWHVDKTMQDYERLFSYAIARAQAYKLYKYLPVFDQIKKFNKDVWDITGLSHAELTAEQDWQPVMNHYGKLIREAKSD